VSAPEIFGTDGIRGRAGEGWLAADGAALVGYSVGRVIVPSGGRALLAHDGRRSGLELEAALASGLAAAGVDARSAGLLPTPGLAWLTLTQGFQVGVMVSASHNPAKDNGIKVFTGAGEKPSDALQAELEQLLRAGGGPFEAGGAPPHDPALECAYLEHLVRGAEGLALDGQRIVLDCANGAGSRVAPQAFGRLGARVTALAAEPDGDNINAGCGSTHPARLQDEVRARGAHLGVALDGDGDRCILVDERGAVVHGDGILTVLGRHAARNGRGTERIVATVMSNRGLHRALREVGVGVVEVPVGDRAVVESLRSEGLALGGEQSGHIVLGASNAYIGDGIVTALRVLRVLQETGAPLSELAAPYRPFPQVLINVPVQSKPDLTALPDVAARLRRAEEELGVDGRVLLRYSGTENVARVMVEGPDAAHIQDHADSLADAIRAVIG
jgi:phosphoglucosamine mutase